jgi:hypothetical protein
MKYCPSPNSRIQFACLGYRRPRLPPVVFQLIKLPILGKSARFGNLGNAGS